MPALVTNNASGTLASGITASQTTITLGSGQGAMFPAASGASVFWATLINSSNQLEIVKVTGVSGDVLTVVRGQDSSTARAYSTGDKIELRPTAALFNAKLDVDTAAATYATIASDNLKAPLASPSFTGTPTVPTAAVGTNTTQAASTAFVQAATVAAAVKFQGATWVVQEVGGVLYFQVSGVNKAKIDASGNLTVAGNVTAFGTI